MAFTGSFQLKWFYKGLKLSLVQHSVLLLRKIHLGGKKKKKGMSPLGTIMLRSVSPCSSLPPRRSVTCCWKGDTQQEAVLPALLWAQSVRALLLDLSHLQQPQSSLSCQLQTLPPRLRQNSVNVASCSSQAYICLFPRALDCVNILRFNRWLPCAAHRES